MGCVNSRVKHLAVSIWHQGEACFFPWKEEHRKSLKGLNFICEQHLSLCLVPGGA